MNADEIGDRSSQGSVGDNVDPLDAVEAARARGAAERDPARFAVIDALARRARAQHGQARELLVQRVVAMLAAHLAPTDTDANRSAATAPVAQQRALAGLSDLIDRLGRSAAWPASRHVLQQPASARRPEALARTAPPPLKAVTAFKGTWSRLRVEQRLRQALAQVPPGAGPLNSSHLVNRALLAMRDLSPEYLDAFMSHIDTLQWLDQASGGGEPAPRAAAPAETRRRPVARAARKA